MKILFDPAKSARNATERNLPFERAADFEFGTALVDVDERHDYGEVRYVALGFLGGRLHVLCFCKVPGGIRVISLRRANRREIKSYEQAREEK
ncbi:MAG: BrnT family toxin [Rhodospirillales bacterium]|nr:MAG: BrnT family toxin [Rhodospirillales bacterium]